MTHPGWYLIAYDITHPRRLQRVHRLVQAEAIALQRSLFLVKGTVADIEDLLDRLATLIDPREDDLRAYPVEGPEQIQRTGPGVLQGTLLCDDIVPVSRLPPAALGWRRWSVADAMSPSTRYST